MKNTILVLLVSGLIVLALASLVEGPLIVIEVPPAPTAAPAMPVPAIPGPPTAVPAPTATLPPDLVYAIATAQYESSRCMDDIVTALRKEEPGPDCQPIFDNLMALEWERVHLMEASR